jgi:SAM-dependent methyltransferase
MSSYAGRHADLYDLFYAGKPYPEEAGFVHRCLQQYGIGQVRRLLEIACGTGSHALVLEGFGYEIVATDYSLDMLAVARQKAARRSSKVDFRHQNMRSVNLPGPPFDAVICLFDSLGYVITNEAIKQTLLGVHQSLRNGGLFIFEFWHAGAMLCHYEPLRLSRYQTEKGEVLRIAETHLDYHQQLCRVRYTIYELNRDGTYTRFEETQFNRYFLVQEMAAYLIENGFTPVKWFSGFNDSEDITGDTWHVVALARKDYKD